MSDKKEPEVLYHATLWSTTPDDDGVITEPDMPLCFAAKDKATAEDKISWMNSSCRMGKKWVLDGPAEGNPFIDTPFISDHSRLVQENEELKAKNDRLEKVAYDVESNWSRMRDRIFALEQALEINRELVNFANHHMLLSRPEMTETYGNLVMNAAALYDKAKEE